MQVLHISEKSVTYLGVLPAPKQLCHKVLYFHILVETTDVSASRAQHAPAPPIGASAHTHQAVTERMPTTATGYLQNNFHLPQGHVLQGSG